MKILIIGSGKQGTALGGLLAQEEGFSEILLADYKLELANDALNKINSLNDKIKTKKITALEIDAGDTQNIIEKAQDADIIFNGTIPKFNLSIMKACLEINAHYLDLYSLPIDTDGNSYDETIDAQFDLHEKFKEKNLVAVPTIGAVPGVSTMLAAHLVNNIDRADKVIIRWLEYMDIPDYVPTVFPTVLLSHWLGKPGPNYYKDGEIRNYDLLDTMETYDFPEPIGKQTVYGEAEAGDLILLPRFANKPIKEIITRSSSVVSDTPLHTIWLDALSKLLAEKNSSDNLIEDLAGYLPNNILKNEDIKTAAFDISIDVIGMENNKRVVKNINMLTPHDISNEKLPWASSGEYSTVGTIPFELILMLSRNELKEKGVISVASLDIPKILERFSKGGHTIKETTKQLTE